MKEAGRGSLGVHLIAELFGCDGSLLNSRERIETVMTDAARIMNATIIKPFFYKFAPHGISGVLVIAESHFTIHTWPEYGYAAFDLFTCGGLDYQGALRHVQEALGAKECSFVEIPRGIKNGDGIAHSLGIEKCVKGQ